MIWFIDYTAAPLFRVELLSCIAVMINSNISLSSTKISKLAISDNWANALNRYDVTDAEVF